MDDKYIINYIRNCKKEAKGASFDRRKAWEELWQVYRNYQDYSKKDKWQSKCFVPKLFMAVERAAGLIEKAVLQTGKLFKAEISSQKDLSDEAKKKFEEEELPDIEKRYKAKLDDSNFANVYSEATKSGLLLGLGVPKVLWDFDEKNLEFENVNILNLFISPSYKPFQKANPRYIIEYKEMDLADLRRIAKDTNKQAKSNVISTTQIRKIQEDYRNEEITSKLRTTLGIGQYERVTKKVGIDEFWGDIIDEDNKVILKDQLCWLVNDKYLIRHQDNPFNHKKPPYILTMPIIYPHRGFAGISFIEHEVKLQYIFNNLVNMGVDKLNWSVNPVFEALDTAIKEPQALTTLYPGKVIHKNVAGKALEQVITTPLGNDVFKMIEFADNAMERGHGVTEFLEGAVGKKPKTLGEVEIKTAQSYGMFDVIARRLERNSLSPTLQMGFDVLTQFSDDFKAENKDMVRFKVGGLSLLLLQSELVKNIQTVLAFALKVPEFRQTTDILALWQKFLGIHNLTEVYKEPEGEQPSPEQLAEVEQRAAADAQAKVAQIPPEQLMQLAGAG